MEGAARQADIRSLWRALPAEYFIVRILCFCCLLLAALPAAAQHDRDALPHSPDATVIRETPLYLQGDTGSDKLGTLEPGREMAILEHNGHWLRVYANIDQDPTRLEDQPVFTNHAPAQPISGWIEDQNVIAGTTPGGQAILFGEAISFEQAASQTHPLVGAAQNAMRLYRMAVELFPSGDRTPEAMWRAADIRWQLQKEDAATLPSAHAQQSYMRELPDESEMRRIEKLYPGSKWASFAAYDLIDNKLCGDWQGQEKCPEQEARDYSEFADTYPDSPRAPEALFEAAWRLAAAGDMWQEDNNDNRATDDRKDAVATAEHLMSKYPTTDPAARAAGLIYKVNHAIPIYGSDRK